MARNQGDISVTLSVLDRLDRQRSTASQVEAPLSRSQSVRLMKARSAATWSGCSIRAVFFPSPTNP